MAEALKAVGAPNGWARLGVGVRKPLGKEPARDKEVSAPRALWGICGFWSGRRRTVLVRQREVRWRGAGCSTKVLHPQAICPPRLRSDTMALLAVQRGRR